MTDVQSHNFPQKFDDTVAVVKSAASNVDASTRQIRQTIEEASAPDDGCSTSPSLVPAMLPKMRFLSLR